MEKDGRDSMMLAAIPVLTVIHFAALLGLCMYGLHRLWLIRLDDARAIDGVKSIQPRFIRLGTSGDVGGKPRQIYLGVGNDGFLRVGHQPRHGTAAGLSRQCGLPQQEAG